MSRWCLDVEVNIDIVTCLPKHVDRLGLDFSSSSTTSLFSGLSEAAAPVRYRVFYLELITVFCHLLLRSCIQQLLYPTYTIPPSFAPGAYLRSTGTELCQGLESTAGMSSYFSSFTSSSAISNLGTRLNSLRRAIISGEEVDDLDHEDSSHVSNVLRAYYAEKGRPFPPWLPPDPKAPAPPPSRIVATTHIQAGGYAQSQNSSSSFGRGGGLSDLWGDSGSPQPPPAQVASLRRGRPGMPPNPTHSAPSGPTGGMPLSQTAGPHPAGARPLPSQRAGSYQTTQPMPPPGQPSQPSQLAPTRAPLDRATSAQERLRARLHGGGGGRSPSPNMGGRPESPYYGGSPNPSARKPVGMGSRG